MDGKTGHEKQTSSLTKSLSLQIKTNIFNIQIKNLLHLIYNLKQHFKTLPKPDFIVCAGHKTHIPMILLKFIYGGKSIVIMKPSLPCGWFDLCIIPKHDNFMGKGLIYRTKGALASTNSLLKKNQKKGLILIGGISKHYEWDSKKLIYQVEELLKKNISINFVLSVSRRTPSDFIKKINGLEFDNLKIHSIKKQNDSWLENQMNKTKYAWISEDSISMIYESLTAGQIVGVLNMSGKKNSRIVNEVAELKKEGLIFANTNKTYKNKIKPNNKFNEAIRCAKFIKKNFCNNN